MILEDIMSQRNRLENYPLFYERIDPKKPSPTEIRETSYDKTPVLTEEQVKALSQDLQKPLNKGQSA
jgi:hypothetical protein